MGSPRFYVDAPLPVGASIALPPAVAHHAANVLRLRDGAPVRLFNGRGGECAAHLQLAGRQVNALIASHDPVEREAPLALTLVQAWIATDKLDWLVEKAVELGAAGVLLYPAARSVVRLPADRRARRLAHLTDLAIAACEQCGRNRVPAVQAADSLRAALQAVAATRRLLLLPDAPSPLAAAGAAGLSLVIGPEGGFADDEVALAGALGCASARLGPRVLRTETAGVAALAALQATAGDLAH